MIQRIENDKIKGAEYATIERCRYYFMQTVGLNLQHINCWIAGGAIRAYFSKDEKIVDIDIFTTGRSEAAKIAIALRKVGFKAFFSNKNAIKGYIEYKGKKTFIDIVKRFYPNEEECLTDFDFSVCKFSINCKTMDFCYSTSSFVDLLQKKLVVPDENYGNPIGSLKRMQKYVNKGYSACNGTILAVAKRLSQTNLSDPQQNDIEFYPDGRSRIFFFD